MPKSKKSETAGAPKSDRKNGKPGAAAATADGAKGAAKQEGRDAWGRRITSSAHDVCTLLATAAKPYPAGELARDAMTAAIERGALSVRGTTVIGAMLQALKLEALAEPTATGWTATNLGRKLWRAGKPQSRKALRAAAAK